MAPRDNDKRRSGHGKDGDENSRRTPSRAPSSRPSPSPRDVPRSSQRQNEFDDLYDVSPPASPLPSRSGHRSASHSAHESRTSRTPAPRTPSRQTGDSRAGLSRGSQYGSPTVIGSARGMGTITEEAESRSTRRSSPQVIIQRGPSSSDRERAHRAWQREQDERRAAERDRERRFERDGERIRQAQLGVYEDDDNGGGMPNDFGGKEEEEDEDPVPVRRRSRRHETRTSITPAPALAGRSLRSRGPPIGFVDRPLSSSPPPRRHFLHPLDAARQPGWRPTVFILLPEQPLPPRELAKSRTMTHEEIGAILKPADLQKWLRFWSSKPKTIGNLIEIWGMVYNLSTRWWRANLLPPHWVDVIGNITCDPDQSYNRPLRPVQFRERGSKGEKIALTVPERPSEVAHKFHPYHVPALFGHASAGAIEHTDPKDMCNHCQKGAGPFKACRQVFGFPPGGGNDKLLWRGACSNCVWMGYKTTRPLMDKSGAEKKLCSFISDTYDEDYWSDDEDLGDEGDDDDDELV